MSIQWFPGHMAKAKRLVQESLKLVDVVIELLDARIPHSSRNPLINEILGPKPRLVVLNKADLADPDLTQEWLKWYKKQGFPPLAVDSLRRQGVARVPAMVREYGKHAAFKPIVRCMVVGVPNVGKSFFINALAGRKVTRTGDRPGITRGRQWVNLGRGVELLDTPGVLWPKFEDRLVAFKLAATGAIKEEVYDVKEVAAWLAQWLMQYYPGSLKNRYDYTEVKESGYHFLEWVAQKRNMLGSGGVLELHRAAVHFLNEFRKGLLGRFTLDFPPQ